MCGIGTWQFAYRKSKWFGSDTIVEQCSVCGDYRKTAESDIEYIEDD